MTVDSRERRYYDYLQPDVRKDAVTNSNLTADMILDGLQTTYMGRNILFFESTGSTQDEASSAAAAGVPEGTIAVAHGQTAGRGRFRRQWIAPAGSTLPVSIVLRPSEAVLPQIVMISALAVARAIENATDVVPEIKWPNDVLIEGRKVCGILVESSSSDNGGVYTISGIGINIHLNVADFPDIAETATSLHLATSAPVERRIVLQRLLEAFEDIYDAAKRGEPVMDRWSDRLVTLGREVSASLNDGSVVEGRAESVDASGALYIRRSDGTLISVIAGDVTLK